MPEKKRTKKNTSSNSKKITAAKTKKTSKKNISQNKNEKKDKKKKIINKDNYLYYIFFLLLFIVIILGVLVFNAKKKNKLEKSNILIPIYEKGLTNELDVNTYELANSKEYSMKIANYKKDKVNKEELEYSITVVNESDAYIKITKDDDKENLMVDQESTKIEGMKLGKNEKEYSIYHFSVIDKTKVKKDEKIHVKITS